MEILTYPTMPGSSVFNAMSLTMTPPQALRDAQASLPDPDAHRVSYNVDAWRRLFAGDPDLEALAARYPRTLSRADVAGIARAALQGATPIRRAFLASMIWGYGTVGYGAFRTARMLRTPDALGQLDRAAAATTAGRLGEAVERFGLQGCGLAFVSKFVYFVGMASEERPLPVILDARVEAALTTLGVDLTQLARSRGPHAGPRWSLTTRRYLTYVDLVDNWARQLACRPDQIEMALFNGLTPGA